MGSNITIRRGGWRSTGRRVLSILAAALVAIGLAACGTGPGGGSGEVKDAGAPLKLGLSMPALDTPFFSVLIQEATAAAQAAGGTVVQTTNANRDSGQQVTDIRNLVTAGANAIIAGIADRKAIQPALDYAASRGVPVVVVDDQPAAGPTAAVVKADNYGMGVTAAEKMAELLPQGGKVLHITGGLETTNGRDRANGFDETVKAKFPNLQIIEQTAKWSGPEAGNVMTTVLSQNPDIAGVYLATDTLYLDPVNAALTGRGRLVAAGQPGHVAMVAIDGGVGALAAIRAGTLDATVSQPVNNYAAFGVQYLQEARAGKKLVAGPTEHDSTVVDVEGYLVDQLPAPVVTKQNVDDKSLWGNKAGTSS